MSAEDNVIKITFDNAGEKPHQTTETPKADKTAEKNNNCAIVETSAVGPGGSAAGKTHVRPASLGGGGGDGILCSYYVYRIRADPGVTKKGGVIEASGSAKWGRAKRRAVSPSKMCE